MPAGRPTKYDPVKTLEATREYIEKYQTLGNEEVIPTIAGLSVHLKISRETIYDWAKDEKKERFSDIIGELMAKQELALMSGGLGGNFNPTITKLALTKHNYSDKQEIGGLGGGAVKFVVEHE